MRSSSKSSSSMKLKIIPKGKKEREKLHKQKSNSSLSGKRPSHTLEPLYANQVYTVVTLREAVVGGHNTIIVTVCNRLAI